MFHLQDGGSNKVANTKCKQHQKKLFNLNKFNLFNREYIYTVFEQ